MASAVMIIAINDCTEVMVIAINDCTEAAVATVRVSSSSKPALAVVKVVVVVARPC